MTKMQKLLKELEKHGFNLYPLDSDKVRQASIYTPAGEDWNIVFESVQQFIDQAENFDVDAELHEWLDAKRAGVSGVPSASELLRDQEWKRDTLQEIANAIK